MKLIELGRTSLAKRKGYFTMVDDEDYEYLNQFNWHLQKDAKGYCYAIRHLKGNNKTEIRMHRELMKLTDKKLFVDHINHNGLDNQKSNLRICTRSQNMANRRKHKKATSKYFGVGLGWYNEKRTWRARIRKDNKVMHIGWFKNELDAALAYNEAAIKYHGEFANINIINND